MTTTDFDAMGELWKITNSFVQYFYAFSGWANLIHKDCECTLETFLETATEEESDKLAAYSQIINDCEKHLSDLQGRMIAEQDK